MGAGKLSHSLKRISESAGGQWLGACTWEERWFQSIWPDIWFAASGRPQASPCMSGESRVHRPMADACDVRGWSVCECVASGLRSRCLDFHPCCRHHEHTRVPGEGDKGQMTCSDTGVSLGWQGAQVNNLHCANNNKQINGRQV